MDKNCHILDLVKTISYVKMFHLVYPSSKVINRLRETKSGLQRKPRESKITKILKSEENSNREVPYEMANQMIKQIKRMDNIFLTWYRHFQM